MLDIVNEFKQGAWGDRYQTLLDCVVTVGLFCTVYESHPEPGKKERGNLISSLMLNGQLGCLFVGKNDSLFSDEGFGGVSVLNSASLRKIRVSFPSISDWH